MSSNEYMREYILKRSLKRREQALEYLGGCCSSCGKKGLLEFDHKDPTTKLFTIAKGYSFSEERFWNEVKKCQLLCQWCHKLKTIKQLGLKIAKGNHGTVSTYHYCKCDECRAAWNKASRDYKRKKKLENETSNHIRH